MAHRHASTASPTSTSDAPGTPRQADELRRAVLDHVSSERRRVFPPTLQVGVPGQHVVRLPLAGPPADELLDHALRVDALEAMVRRVRRPPRDAAPLAWLTRSGPLDVQDTDLEWASAADMASRELALHLRLVVVTRRGWLDPRTGASRTWLRLRPSRS